MRDFTEDFSLLEVEAQGNFGVLQIIVAAPRVGLIREQLRCGDEDRQQRRERKKRETTTKVTGDAEAFLGHSALLL